MEKLTYIYSWMSDGAALENESKMHFKTLLYLLYIVGLVPYHYLYQGLMNILIFIINVSFQPVLFSFKLCYSAF